MSLASPFSFQGHNALQVTRLWKKIEGLNLCDLVVLLDLLEIPNLRRWIATHVDNSLRSKLDELGEKLGTAALSRRIDDDGGLARIKSDFGKNVRRISLNEPAVFDPVLLRGPFCPIDGRFADFNSNCFGEIAC